MPAFLAPNLFFGSTALDSNASPILIKHNQPTKRYHYVPISYQPLAHIGNIHEQYRTKFFKVQTNSKTESFKVLNKTIANFAALIPDPNGNASRQTEGKKVANIFYKRK
ncbi:hypothetical protein T09_6674 [Trichinella sp. T9]|nr:hypothetical protein T09_6674 [Trichinella sp. T9]